MQERNLKKFFKKRYLFYASVIVISLLFVYTYSSSRSTHQPSAQNGVLDLSGWDFKRDGFVELDGEWELYWNKLLTPEDFKKPDEDKPSITGYTKIPSNWNKRVGNTKLKGRGIATYRLLVKNISSQGILGFKKTNIRTSSIVYINGDKIQQDGKPSVSIDERIFGNSPQVNFFQMSKKDMEVIIQVSNYDYPLGGIAAPLYFGEQEDILKLNNSRVNFELMTSTVLLTIGIIYLLLYIFINKFSKDAKIVITFGIFCVFLAIANSMVSERVFLVVFHNISFLTAYKIFQFSLFGSVSSYTILLSKISEELLPAKIRNSVLIIYSLYTILLVMLPIHIYSYSMTPLVVFEAVYFLGVLLRMLIYLVNKKKMLLSKSNQQILLFGFIAMFVYSFYLALYSFGIKNDMFISNISIIAFVISLVFLLAKLLLGAYKDYMEISLKLAVQEKETALNESAFLRSQINPHFLYNALNTIIYYCHTDSNKAGELLMSFSSYLRGSFDFDKLESLITLENEMKLVNSYVDLEKARFGDSLKVIVDIEPELFKIKIPALSIQPLVENSIRHGIMKREEGGSTRIHVYRKEDNVIIEVSDDGVGMSPDMINRILSDENININTSRRGVGLQNIKKRVEDCFESRLYIESEEDRGTTVYLKLNDQALKPAYRE